METTETTAVCHYICGGCGADLTYSPDTTNLTCSYCGAEKQIGDINAKPVIEESDYRSFLSDNASAMNDRQTINTITCKSCGATVELKEHVTSDNCAFCGTPLVIQDAHSNTILKPKYLLPFKISQTNAQEAFRAWLKKLWFAPNRLKHYGDQNDTLCGVYIPYWTYDSSTTTSYSGQKGIDHHEYYTVTVNGRREQRTRVVTHWHFVSGNVNNSFDDILVLASSSLPRNCTDKLEPWDLVNLKEFDEQYICGFRTECYQTGLEQGFAIAKNVMQQSIESSIRRDIGGDHQRITSSTTTYNTITFKHILLPLWISAYRFKDKIYRFMINGRTGEVQGEHPWSWIKITLASLAAIAAGTAIYFVYTYFGG